MKWVELAHEKRGYIYPTALYWLGAQHVCKEVGMANGIIGIWYKDHEFSYLCTPGSFSGAGKIILEKLKSDKSFLKKIIDTNETLIPKMLKSAEKLSGDLSKINGKGLLDRWNDFQHIFLKLMTYSAMGTVMEMEEPALTNEITNLLEKKLGKANPEKGRYFQILSTNHENTLAGHEELSLVRLKLKQLTNKLTEDDIDNHLAKYSFLPYGYDGPGWTAIDIKNRLDALDNNIDTVGKKLCSKKKHNIKLKEEQEKAEQELKLDENEKHLFKIMRILGFWKFQRKIYNQKAHEMMEGFIEKIAKRNSLTVEQAKMIAPYEYEEVFIKNKVDKNVLDSRIKESFVLYKGTDYKVLSSEELKSTLKEIKDSLKVDTSITELKGSTAYPGKAEGRVKIIDTPQEMEKMEKGDILVSASTSPHILPAMKKAGAIVTDSGGITCHAAIVAREIKIPTVIGTKVATKIFKDNDLVEVDAGKGIVKKR